MSRTLVPSPNRRRPYRVDVTIPLAIHLPTRGETPGAPLCLSEVVGRVTITHSGRLRVSVRGAIVLDTYSEPVGELYNHGRCGRVLDAIMGKWSPGAHLKIRTLPKAQEEGEATHVG